MSRYKLIDEANGTTVGSIETLELPPNTALVVSLPAEMLDRDMARVRDELHQFFAANGIDRPVGFVRAGDIKFVRLVQVSE